ncbi:glycosyltransferase family 4 protein [Cytophagaceae bacterium ABcell3]|nr:glycosyltransferase family 4 protein [Cytophagaceae bacterium ABcell3]
MKIIYVHQYFKTPEEGGAIRSWHLTHALIEAGHQVELITAHNKPQPATKYFGKLKVHYLPVFYDNRLGVFARLMAFFKFSFKAFKCALSIADADLCYITSTPLSTGIVGLLLKRFRSIPYYFEVRDLWPEAPIQMKVINNWVVVKMLLCLERRIYNSAATLIALSPAIRDSIMEKLSSEKQVLLVPNFSDCEFFQQSSRRSKYLEKHKIAADFVVAYTGAFGRANNIDFIFEIVKASASAFGAQVHFVFAGDGAEKVRLMNMVQEIAIGNTTFLGHLNKTEVREVLHAADAVLVSFLPLPVLRTTSPNKFFDGLAAGKVCITNTKGWLKEIIESNEIGFYAPPDAPEVFVEKLKGYLVNPHKKVEASKNARMLAENRFSLDIMKKRFLQSFGHNERGF